MNSSAPIPSSASRRASTTSAMYINHTLEIPNRDLIIYSMAKSIHCTLGFHSEQAKNCSVHLVSLEIPIFSENKFPLTEKKRNFTKLPNLEEIVLFLKFWFYKQVLSPQVGIMAIHYIDLLINKGLLITPANWRRVLLCALMIADKVWEEDVVCNSDYCNDVFPLLTVEELNAMERKFLSLLDFKLVLKTSVYAEYYFALRSISGHESFPSRPLDKHTAQFLHTKSTETDRVPKRRRSLSADTRKKKEKPEETVALSYEQFSQIIHNDNISAVIAH